MALSSIIKLNCKTCGKLAVEKSRINFGTTKMITLECGHITSEEVLAGADYNSIVSSDGRRLMQYQIDDLMKIADADARAVLAWEQGLGKTIAVCALLKLYSKELLPCVIVTKTAIKLQTHHEIIRWNGVKGFLTQVISSGKEFAAPGFDIYIITYDLLKNENVFKLIPEIKFVVLDECQAIKDHTSGRAKAALKLVKNVEHVLPMSGTPIKNNAGEYFTILNMVRPRMFPQYVRFIEDDCDSYNNGWGYKVGGLRNPEAFHEKTKDFIFRRTKAEVLPDLPKLFRKFYHAELDRRLNKRYAELLNELEEKYYSEESTMDKQAMMLAIMNKLRQITGVSKVEQCEDFLTEFLESCDRKIVVFTHHEMAHTLLVGKMKKYCQDNALMPPLELVSSLSAEARQDIIKKFKDTDSRIMVASTLASGEGLNLQFCSDAIMLERQWNPANEEQAEARFHRFGQENSVNVTYMIASETIDEYFTDLVEQKRAIVGSALDNKEFAWDQSSLLTELATLLIAKGKKAWTLDRIK
jgi:SNF2 family DNA or RNA helicase